MDLKQFLIILCLNFIIQAQNYQCTQDLESKKFKKVKLYTKIKILINLKKGDKVVLCAHFTQIGKIPFEVTVDKYVGLDIKSVYDQASKVTDKKNNIKLLLQVHNQKAISTAIDYLTIDQKLYPLYSAVIYIRDGRIISVEWDNACWDVKQQCGYYNVIGSDNISVEERNNYIKQSECTSSPKIM
ncbi:hypothetical protein IMG5_055190 [Ichthyophthirius multifiliis]|uniref:Uncharacterized protein n=1 Tax=Ichthyophthirius multifiliis TaxID=5932 RepID=G0QN47_ICHMU|nr:hypothetical protein IMG5_055190 [Ichthyophthirius multifiliis]EGR33376.1 hypothetical protein IMG5_055190 [Ichthyophthirius multifiliis]|eukprot:XP_004037362.1 hypothetical protein IMG5_055190 [Ichthyophthirius multifiliis]